MTHDPDKVTIQNLAMADQGWAYFDERLGDLQQVALRGAKSKAQDQLSRSALRFMVAQLYMRRADGSEP